MLHCLKWRSFPRPPPDHIAIVRQLFEEYWQSFGFTPCFQNFAAEVAALPGYYAPPSGRLALALRAASPRAASRSALSTPCARKPSGSMCGPGSAARAPGLALLQWVIGEARAAGYREMLGDTMPVMRRALAMYDRLGFEQTGPYMPDATPGAIYLRLLL